MPKQPLVFSQYIDSSREIFMFIAKDGKYSYNDWIKAGTSWKDYYPQVINSSHYKFKLILSY